MALDRGGTKDFVRLPLLAIQVVQQDPDSRLEFQALILKVLDDVDDDGQWSRMTSPLKSA